VRVRFTPEARLAVREKRAWWEQHREKAPRLFGEELAAIVRKLRNGADDERQQYAARGGRMIWSILMPKTRNHVYYRLNEVTEEVEIVLVWNAVAGRPRRSPRSPLGSDQDSGAGWQRTGAQPVRSHRCA